MVSELDVRYFSLSQIIAEKLSELDVIAEKLSELDVSLLAVRRKFP